MKFFEISIKCTITNKIIIRFTIFWLEYYIEHMSLRAISVRRIGNHHKC